MTLSRVHVGPHRLPGDLECPAGATGLVLFAHGSGSSRLSPRNRFVAQQLNARGLATLLFDLLTDAEALDRRNVFDIPRLAQRLGEAIEWQRSRSELASLPIGLFGASTGAAAALVAAAAHAGPVRAVVSRGGRPDLAGAALPHVRAATLLIVGGADPEVLALNREAAAQLRCENALHIVPGATHLFEEPGTLEAVAVLAADWFALHLTEPSHA
jgi:pimeloyl-ACP methyl ester carboxylesterase